MKHPLRTSIILEKSLMFQIRKLARERQLPLTTMIALLLREGLEADRHASQKQFNYQFLPTVVKGSAPPSIDISNRSALTDFMDEDNDSSS